MTITGYLLLLLLLVVCTRGRIMEHTSSASASPSRGLMGVGGVVQSQSYRERNDDTVAKSKSESSALSRSFASDFFPLERRYLPTCISTTRALLWSCPTKVWCLFYILGSEQEADASILRSFAGMLAAAATLNPGVIFSY